MEPVCLYCKKWGNMICSRCQNVVYCEKKCQRADWIKHKLTCLSAEQKKQLIETVHQKILGNILIILSHHYTETTPIDIIIEINEKVENILEDALHFAHIHYVPSADYNNYITENFNCTLSKNTETYSVVYILENYHIYIPVPLEDLSRIKTKYHRPDTIWSISF